MRIFLLYYLFIMNQNMINQLQVKQNKALRLMDVIVKECETNVRLSEFVKLHKLYKKCCSLYLN